MTLHSPLSVFQDEPGDHSRGGDALRSVSSVALQCGGPSARAWHRHLLRNASVLVALACAAVCRKDPQAAHRGEAVEPLALALGRGRREDQRRDALSLAGSRSRGRGAQNLRYEAAR